MSLVIPKLYRIENVRTISSGHTVYNTHATSSFLSPTPGDSSPNASIWYLSGVAPIFGGLAALSALQLCSAGFWILGGS